MWEFPGRKNVNACDVTGNTYLVFVPLSGTRAPKTWDFLVIGVMGASLVINNKPLSVIHEFMLMT